MDNERPRRHLIGNFLLNMLPTFLGVLLAFWLSEWASERNFKAQERHLLVEIQHELELNLTDLNTNLKGHKIALKSIERMRAMLSTDSIGMDSLHWDLINGLRDFTSIQHTAAYETLKTRGIESITDDSLRLEIPDLYDFEFESIEKIEEQYSPHEFFVHYNEPVLQSLTKCYDFLAPAGTNKLIMPLSALPGAEKNLLAARLKKIQYDRAFSIHHYEKLARKVEKVIGDIKRELGK